MSLLEMSPEEMLTEASRQAETAPTTLLARPELPLALLIAPGISRYLYEARSNIAWEESRILLDKFRTSWIRRTLLGTVKRHIENGAPAYGHWDISLESVKALHVFLEALAAQRLETPSLAALAKLGEVEKDMRLWRIGGKLVTASTTGPVHAKKIYYDFFISVASFLYQPLGQPGCALLYEELFAAVQAAKALAP